MFRTDEERSLKDAGKWFGTARRWISRPGIRVAPVRKPVIGLALGGGFARGIAHIGVLRVFEQNNIPIDCIAGVSAGAMVAAAFASGANTYEIEEVARSMKFKDIARWTISRMGLAGSERMVQFLHRLLKVHTFEEMKIPLSVVATDLCTGNAVNFTHGDVHLPIRASCSYPGLFLPIRDGNRHLVDGAMSIEVPALPLRQMGATHVLSVSLPMQEEIVDPGNMFSVVNRCFQILQRKTERDWKRLSNAVICPEVSTMSWDCFVSTQQLIDAGMKAALEALPAIRSWLETPAPVESPVKQALLA